MKFARKSFKLIDISSLFLIFNIISKLHCLIELPISNIKVLNIPKYPIFNPNTGIPEYIRNKTLYNNKYYKKLNKNDLLNSSGDLLVISNLLYVVNIRLGSSKQLFSLLVDTGSSITWVPKINSSDYYQLSNHYDPSLSSTSIKKEEEPFEIIYGSGSAKGEYYSDKIIYIKDKEFKMDFGAAHETNFLVSGADGILGLSRLYDDYDKSFIHMMCKEHITSSKIFSIKLGLNALKNLTGSFYIGKHDDFNKNSVVSCELNNNNYYEVNYWACNIYSLTLVNKLKNKEIISEKKVSVIFDTGTNAIFLPLNFLKDIENELENMNCYIKKYESLHQPDRYRIICLDQIPDFKLNIGGHNFILLGEYFFSYSKGYAYSELFFQNSNENDDNLFIIGSPFFMLFHVLFDSYTKELFFYPEIEGTIIKGTWWNLKHTILFVTFVGIILFTLCLIIVFLLWKKNNKLELDEKLDDNYEVRTMFGLL